VNNPDKIFNAVELGRNAYEYMIYCLDNCNLYFRDNVQYDAPENDTDISRIVLNGKPIESIYDLE
jgi:hypothetical protein